jgi:hypothetical protein
MSKIIKEITCITGSYTVANGEKKNRYSRIGSIIETKNGPMLKIDSIPLKEGGWDGWAYINDPRPQESREQPIRKSSGFDDMMDTPF